MKGTLSRFREAETRLASSVAIQRPNLDKYHHMKGLCLYLCNLFLHM